MYFLLLVLKSNNRTKAHPRNKPVPEDISMSLDPIGED